MICGFRKKILLLFGRLPVYYGLNTPISTRQKWRASQNIIAICTMNAPISSERTHHNHLTKGYKRFELKAVWVQILFIFNPLAKRHYSSNMRLNTNSIKQPPHQDCSFKYQRNMAHSEIYSMRHKRILRAIRVRAVEVLLHYHFLKSK